jgi:hypothetical protein
MPSTTSIELPHGSAQNRGGRRLTRGRYDDTRGPNDEIPDGLFVADALKLTALDHIETYRRLHAEDASERLIDNGTQAVPTGEQSG